MTITFSHPEYLVFLFIIPVIILIHLLSIRSAKKRAVKFANFEAIKRVTGVELYSKNLTSLYLSLAVVILVVFALSGLGITQDSNTGKNSFVITIDSSRSMGVDDIKPTRLESAKKAATDFLNMLPSETRVGVVSFSGTTLIESDMITDKSILKNVISEITLKSAGGTDILNALVTSSNLLRIESGKTIILLSDGGFNSNSLQEILDYALKNNVIIYTLGIGTEQGATDETGATYKISADALRILAENTGGKYYPVAQLDDFYSSLTNIVEVVKARTLISLSNYLLMIALIVIVINFFIINNKFRSFP